MPSDAHDENIVLYVKLLAESAQDTAARQKMLLRSLAEERRRAKRRQQSSLLTHNGATEPPCKYRPPAGSGGRTDTSCRIRKTDAVF